ncbi:response regulator transcription factor [Frateuria defendens]|uniref:response regulator transcription factor n=1 Tax=Frateuria defendens TaxID=2219559 RepID=UPI00066FE06B|nr:response regulator transcription factor [Frateuria defendens]
MTLRIVIADDHPIVLLGCRMMIEQGGAVVAGEARNPQELFRTLAETPCDALVTDFAMPGGGQADGLAMLGLIRRRYPELPIVVLTNMSNPGLLRTILGDGVRGIVEKGAEMGELMAAVRTAMKGKAYLSSKLRTALEEQGLTAQQSEHAPQLSPREKEVLRLLASGMTPTEVGQLLHRTVKAVSFAKVSAKRKLGLKSDAELYEYARSHHLAS